VGLRCAIAAFVIVPFVLLLRPPVLRRGFATSAMIVAGLFAAALTIQQAAYTSTSVTNASFLVNTGTVVTPILAWFWIRERPGWSLAVAVPLTLWGALLMSGAAVSGLSTGDAACIVSALLYAAWMVQLGDHARRFGAPATTALVQFAFAALVCLPAGLWLEAASLHAVGAAGPELLMLGAVSTAAAFGLQTIAQRHTPAGHAAVIVSAESVFGAVGAFFLLSERATSDAVVGAGLIMVAIFLISVAPGRVPRIRALAATQAVPRSRPA
jgi:drug/metabolite transporter (DMT)-like permease